VLVVAPEVTPAIEGMAGAGELIWASRGFADADLDGAWYALACTHVPAVNAEVAAGADRRRIFCVRADSAPGGSAVTPAVGRHDGLTVGVLAGRAPPARRPCAPRSWRPCRPGWWTTRPTR
jgi:uroporphyrin-III C-methyltransferase/precorrin-2 dehydrogenase/sirohydrochlorin ferrochelatase